MSADSESRARPSGLSPGGYEAGTGSSARARLVHVAAECFGALDPRTVSALMSVPLTDPAAIRSTLAEFAGSGRKVVVTGTLDRRLVLVQDEGPARAADFNCAGEDSWTVADLSGQPHGSRVWPSWIDGAIVVGDPHSWVSRVSISPEGRRRLLRPRVLLVSLYHPEVFPLPRFALGISDLARAARATLVGSVELADMQLGMSIEEIIARATGGDVDVLGVSVTFGQHDLAVRLLDAVYSMPSSAVVPAARPLVLAGGSLSARNERILLERYPELLVGRGAGEPVLQDVLLHWHGLLPREAIRGIAYRAAEIPNRQQIERQLRHTAGVTNRHQVSMWPELDLLASTLARGGVAQLETSRGCTNFCSFCPRGHKGQWFGGDTDTLPVVLDELSAVFDVHPETARVLYLVDEEFIGRGADAVQRARSIAGSLDSAGFAWETSCRIDQVVRLDADREWHLERARLWRALVEHRLRRCLFGVESGVTSVLERFAKETSGPQNALAIRTLTALGVPPRFTYITFDHLMNAGELRETFAFQGRTDLLIRAQPQLSVDEIVDGVRDEEWVRQHASSRPFYTAISYMLVGMECLIGAAYTRRVQAAGLAGAPDPGMGRVDARYANWRIGVLARWAQLWIDRNFALDYTLKSLEKITTGEPNRRVRGGRRLFKDAAYDLLGAMIGLLDQPGADRWAFEEACADLAEVHRRTLELGLAAGLTPVQDVLNRDQSRLLQQEYQRWAGQTTWQLINASDPCGT
jgi:hypothetical protein